MLEELTLHPVELPLRHAWKIAHGTRTVQQNLIVALHDQETGHTGYGEAPGIPYMGVTAESMVDRLTEGHPPKVTPHINADWQGFIQRVFADIDKVSSRDFGDLQRFRVNRKPEVASQFVANAIDQAAHDLWGKRQGVSIRSVWQTNGASSPLSNYTLGMAEPDELVAKLHEFPDFPAYKIKLGSGDPRKDLAIVEHLRQHTDAAFRVDANTAWDAEQTIRLSGPLRDLGVEFIEQPLPPDAPHSEHEAVYFGSDLPVIADESCQTEDDVEKCAGLFHGINIKLTKCGGMTPARRMIARARELDLKVMMGCMTETTVGISAVAQFLPLLDYVDMDGALLLAEDVADGVRLGPDGRAVFPEGAAGYGNGVTLTRELPAV